MLVVVGIVSRSPCGLVMVYWFIVGSVGLVRNGFWLLGLVQCWVLVGSCVEGEIGWMDSMVREEREPFKEHVYHAHLTWWCAGRTTLLV